MAETIKGEKLLDWSCRIFMTLDIVVILSGYIKWFESKRQLVTPLIPSDTIYTIFSDGGDIHFRNSIIAGCIFLPGLWLYSFKQKGIALVFFILAVLWIFIKNVFIRM